MMAEPVDQMLDNMMDEGDGMSVREAERMVASEVASFAPSSSIAPNLC